MATAAKKIPPSPATPSSTIQPARKSAAKPKAASPTPTMAAKPNRPKTRTAAPTTASAKAPAQFQPSSTKQAQLINLLRSQGGASMAQMTALTGWQQHTVRGTISATLRKKLGLDVACETRNKDGARLYRITSPAA